MTRRTRGWTAVAVVALLLAAVGAGSGRLITAHTATGAFHLQLAPDRDPDVRPRPDASVLLPPQAVHGGDSTTALHVLLTVLAVLAALLVVAVLLLLVVRSGRRWRPVSGPRTEPPEPAVTPAAATSTEQLVRSVGLAREALAAGGDERGLVLRAWSRLEQAVAATGRQRAPGETSAELTRRVLHEHSVRARPLTELHALYQQARYSQAPVDADAPSRTDALLRDVEEDLTGARSG